MKTPLKMIFLKGSDRILSCYILSQNFFEGNFRMCLPRLFLTGEMPLYSPAMCDNTGLEFLREKNQVTVFGFCLPLLFLLSIILF